MPSTLRWARRESTACRGIRRGNGMGFYMVERYVPAMTGPEVASATARLAGAVSDGVRHLYSVLVSGEDTCLSVFEAPDVRAVEVANEWAGFPLDRIVEVSIYGEPQE